MTNTTRQHDPLATFDGAAAPGIKIASVDKQGLTARLGGENPGVGGRRTASSWALGS